MSHALYFSGDCEAFETAYFVDKMDKFFDTLNVSSFSAGKHNRKPFQDPIRNSSDFRMKVQVCMYSYTVIIEMLIPMYCIQFCML